MIVENLVEIGVQVPRRRTDIKHRVPAGLGLANKRSRVLKHLAVGDECGGSGPQIARQPIGPGAHHRVIDVGDDADFRVRIGNLNRGLSGALVIGQ